MGMGATGWVSSDEGWAMAATESLLTVVPAEGEAAVA